MRLHKILIVSRDLPFSGGVPNVLYNYLSNSYIHKKNALFIIATLKKPSKQMVEKFKQFDVKVICLGDSGYFLPFIELVRFFLNSRGVKLVVPCAFKPYLLVKMAHIFYSFNIIYWIHGVKNLHDSLVKNFIYRTISVKTNFIFISKAAQSWNFYSNFCGNSEIIYNAVLPTVNNKASRVYIRNELSYTANEFIYCYVAEFVAIKNHKLLIDTFVDVYNRFNNSRLLLIGTGDLFESIKIYINENNISSVRLLGTRTDTRKILSCVDVYVHPADGEGFGLAITEAMHEGLPVIVSRSGAPMEYVEDYQNGLFFLPNNKRDLIRKMIKLYNNDDLRQKLGRNAKKYVRKRFSIKGMAEKIDLNFLKEFPTS